MDAEVMNIQEPQLFMVSVFCDYYQHVVYQWPQFSYFHHITTNEKSYNDKLLNVGYLQVSYTQGDLRSIQGIAQNKPLKFGSWSIQTDTITTWYCMFYLYCLHTVQTPCVRRLYFTLLTFETGRSSFFTPL